MRPIWFAVLVVGAMSNAALASVFTGTDSGALSNVKSFDSTSGIETSSFMAYGPSFSGGVRVAAGDINGDGIADVVTGAGPGGSGHVKVFDGSSGTEIRSFLAYGSYSGGVFVAAGDVNNDLQVDLVTGTDSGVGPHVKVFNGSTSAEIRSFFAYSPSFTGGVRVATGDVNGDGFADIVTGAGAAGAGHVKVFDGSTGTELRSFLAYGSGYSGGVFVAAGDVNNDGLADLVTGTDSGVGPHVKVFDGLTGTEIRSFFAYGPSFTGGVRVAAGDVNGDGFAEIITGAGDGGSGHVKVFDGITNAEKLSFLAYGERYSLGVFVASTDLVPEPATIALLVPLLLLTPRRRKG